MSVLVQRYWLLPRSVFARINCNFSNIRNALSLSLPLSSSSRITIESTLSSPLSFHQSAYFATIPRARLDGGTSTSTSTSTSISTSTDHNSTSATGLKNPKRPHLSRDEIAARAAAKRKQREKIKEQAARTRERRRQTRLNQKAKESLKKSKERAARKRDKERTAALTHRVEVAKDNAIMRERPKRRLSSYLMFFIEKSPQYRPSVIRATPGIDVHDQIANRRITAEVARRIGSEWKSMTDEQRRPYILRSEEQIPVVAASKEEWEKQNFPPKRPMSAYIRWAAKERPTVRQQNPTLPIIEISKLLGQQWKSVDQRVKDELQTEYARELPSYRQAYDSWKQRYNDEIAQKVEQRKHPKSTKTTPTTTTPIQT